MRQGIETGQVVLDAEAAAIAYKAYEIVSYRVPNSRESIPELSEDGSWALGETALRPMLECIVESSILTQRQLNKINEPKIGPRGWRPGQNEQNERINVWRNDMEYRLASMGSIALLLHDSIENQGAKIIQMPGPEERDRLVANRWRTRVASNSSR